MTDCAATNLSYTQCCERSSALGHHTVLRCHTPPPGHLALVLLGLLLMTYPFFDLNFPGTKSFSGARSGMVPE